MKYHAVCKRCVVQRSPWCAVLFTTLAIPLILNGSLPVRVFAASPRAPANRVSPGINATPWDEDSDDPTLINMGPIGARAKTDHLLKGLPESHSSFGVIKYIFKGSPAEDKLQLGDVVVGVNDEPFNRDFSRRLGAAIDWREGNTGTLKLNIRRQEKPLALMFAVPKIGSFSATFPYDCDKSDAVLEAALDWLAERQWPNGKLEGDSRSGYSVCTAVAGLAFLGSGKAKYTGNIDLIVEYFLDHFANRRTPDGHFGPTSLEGWQLMYGAMFLSEYYLATCNQRIPPMLVYLNQEIDRLQFRHLDAETVAFLNKQHPKNGVPPYWFGHAKISQGHKGTYFHLGVNTANALVAWGLINECGVAIDRGNIARTMDYVQVACPSGEMGYAGRPDQRGGADDSFGRTGVLAMAYHFNDDRPAFGQKINAALQRHCREHYFTSHSSAVMGKAWGTLGIAASNPVLFRQVMDHFKYDYDLIRLHDGRFVANPAHWHQAGHPQCDLKRAFGDGHRWTTTFNAFLFTLSKRRLRLTGGGLSIWGVEPTELNGDLRSAFALIQAHRYDDAIDKVSKLLRRPRAAADRETAKSMLAYATNFEQASETTQQEIRTWTDSKGQHSLEATFVGLESGNITLRKTDGSLLVVPLKQLSRKDLQWVNKTVRESRKRKARG